MKKSAWLLVCSSILVSVVTLNSRDSLREGLANTANSAVDGEFTVHEWGTFTTFSGSDGVFLDFRPLAESQSDLPDYVLDRGAYSKSIIPSLSKSRLRGRVRMETPVTYFYSDRIRTVDVSVDFPEGLLTEFYPPVRELLPLIDEENVFGDGEKIGKSSLNWGRVDIIPLNAWLPSRQNESQQQMLSSHIIDALIPHAANEQHYSSARETDSAIVHVRNAEDTRSYFEKFLFYRGVGKFQLPIATHFDHDKAFVSNDGALPIRSCIFIDIDGDRISVSKVDQVNSGESVAFDGLRSVTQDQLAEMVQQCLVSEGLYEKEAASMVQTWKQSWFTEQGSRVLYMLPGQTTDELLPLNITPRPQKMLRVLVGRMEVMSPSDEQAMIAAVSQSAASRSVHNATRRKSGSKTAYAIPESISKFGRMAEPALARVAALTSEPSVRFEAGMLLRQIQSQ